MDFYRRRGKRLIDIGLSALGLAVSLPFQAAAAVVVVSSMGRPVLFRQQRPGQDAQPFTIIKFRTMVSEVDANGDTDADRLTKAGSVLRSLSLDELPELVNVLRGEMSLVGPRPLLMEYLPRYSDREARRHEVRPGVTGWAQVNGRNELEWSEKFELDVWYVDNVSLQLDLKILWLTLAGVLRRTGIAANGHATAPEFLPPHA